nr:EOG090X058A [Eulimnadia texana]
MSKPNTKKLFLKYKCGYCQEEIVGVRIRCTACSDYDLCLQCFALGAEAGPHKNSHGYTIMDPGTFHLFPEPEVTISAEEVPWSSRDEYQLLDAIEQYGYGNWEDVAKHVEIRDPETTKEHFCERYVYGVIGRVTWPSPHGNCLQTGEPRLMAVDHTCPDNGPLSPTITSRLPPLVVQTDEALELGYMPHRDDFEKEHDNEAELVVSHLSINHDDEDVDLALKLAQVDMYVRRLRERARRKRVVRDYQLVTQFFSGSKKAKDEKTAPVVKKRDLGKEKELQEKFKVFSQFHTASEHEQFLRNLCRERYLKNRVRELIKYRRNGLTRHEECPEYERARYYREKRQEAQQERSMKSGSSGPGPTHNPATQQFDVKGEVTNSRDGRATLKQFSNEGSDCGSWPKSTNHCGSSSAAQSAAAVAGLFQDQLSLFPGYELLNNNERQNPTDKPRLLDGLTNDEQRIIQTYLSRSGLLNVS